MNELTQRGDAESLGVNVKETIRHRIQIGEIRIAGDLHGLCKWIVSITAIILRIGILLLMLLEDLMLALMLPCCVFTPDALLGPVAGLVE